MDTKLLDVYLYGMTVYSTLHLLDHYPEPDTYGEIKDTYQVVGGEVGNSAIVLASLGCRVRIDGPYLGSKTAREAQSFMGRFGIDCSLLKTDDSFDGVMDMVLIDKQTRTVFGRFGEYFSGPKLWSMPHEKSISDCSIVALDPFFKEESLEVSRICKRLGKPYVTIDSPFDSEIYKNAAAIVVSNEYIQNHYKGFDITELMNCYLQEAEGLVIFTFGGREIFYGRKGCEVKRILPYKVEVKSTLGAGDTFRAGVVYGLMNGFDDDRTVRFAAATAAMVCTRFPFALNPPSLDEIEAMAENRQI